MFDRMVDLKGAKIWKGRVDRLSSKGNAIVEADDVDSYDKSDDSLNSETNLGPLPADVISEQVTFIYEGVSFGLCIDAQWASEAYLDDILSKVNFSVDEMGVRSGILDANSDDELTKGAIYTASPWTDDRWSEYEHEYQPIVKLHHEDADLNEERVHLGIIEGPLPPGDLPITVQVTEIRGVVAVVEARTTQLASGVPKVGEVCVVQTKGISKEGTIAVYDADQPIPVLIRDVEYPIGGSLDVRITERNASHLTAEPELRDVSQVPKISAHDIDFGPSETPSRIIRNKTPIDIRSPLADVSNSEEIIVFEKAEEALIGAWNMQAVSNGYDDLSTGETIEMDVRSVDGNRLLGFQGDFPIVCYTDRELSTDLQDIPLRVTIESIAPDRATATLASSPFEEGDVVSITATASSNGDMLSVDDGHLIQIASSDLIPSEQTFRAGIESSGPISRASVCALPEFRLEEERMTQVRLHSTTGDVVLVDGIPMKTRDLPDLTKSVTLGIDRVNADHVVPSVVALPDSHIPGVGDCMVVTVDDATDAATASAVGEQLPIELLKPPSVALEQTYARVFECGSDKLRAVATTIADDESPEGFSEQLQLASSLVTIGEYTIARSVLSVARTQLPAGYPIVDAIVDARYALLCSADLFSNNADSSAIDILHKARDKTSSKDEIDASGDLSQLLDAYNLEVRAAIACADAYENVRSGDVTHLQAIARATETKQPVEETIQKLQTASQRMKTTEFELSSPSGEIMRFLRQFEENFPYPIQELPSWLSKHEAHTASDDWLDVILPVNTNTTGDKPSYFELTSADRNSEQVWERPVLGSNTIPCTPTAEEPQGDLGIAQKSSVKASTTEESIDTDHLDKDDSLGDIATEETAGTAPDSSPDTDDLSAASEKTAADMSPGSSRSVTVEQEEDPYTTDPEQDDSTESSGITESSVSVPDNKIEQTDSPQTIVTDEIPDATSKLRRLRKQAEADATENPVKHTTTTSTGAQYRRSDKIREYALARADGRCEACGNVAPFDIPSGEPFLEVHHVHELGKGGADNPTLVIAVCPNCHREIHYGKHGNQLNEELKNKLEEGLGDVGST